jgi:hypothetical protein
VLPTELRLVSKKVGTKLDPGSKRRKKTRSPPPVLLFDYMVAERDDDEKREERLNLWAELGHGNPDASSFPAFLFVRQSAAPLQPPADLKKRQRSMLLHDDTPLHDGRLPCDAFFLWTGTFGETDLLEEVQAWTQHAVYPWVDKDHAASKATADRAWAIAEEHGVRCAPEEVPELHQGTYTVVRFVDL